MTRPWTARSAETRYPATASSIETVGRPGRSRNAPHSHSLETAGARPPRPRQRQRSVIRKPTIIVPRPTAMFHAPSFGTGYVPDEM